METPVMDNHSVATQNVELIRGKFTPSETKELIRVLIEQKINFHKIKRLQLWEGNHQCETADIKIRIKELEAALSEVQAFLIPFEDDNKTVQINAVVELNVIGSENG